MKTQQEITAKSDRRSFDLGTVMGGALGTVCLSVVGIGLLLLLAAIAPASLSNNNGFWYLSRSSALVGYVMLWASMAFGVSITNKLSRIWPGAPATFDLHQYTGLLGLGFVVLHMLSLLGDTYIGYNLLQVFVPFASTGYQQFWVGIGQLAFFILVPVTLSFYLRKRLGTRGWRTVHGLSYALFGMSLLHGLFSGTDSGAMWTSALYWFSALSLLGLTAYRVALVYTQPQKKSAAAQSSRLMEQGS